jgi:integrase/recombinase XerC
MNTLKRFINYIKVEKRYSDHTVRAYSDDLEQFIRYLGINHGINDLLAVNHQMVRQWVVFLLNESAVPRTLRRKAASLNSFYKFCLRNQLITVNPANGLILPRLNKSIPDFIKESSIAVLFDAAAFSDDFPGNRDKIVLELFYATGMRLAELVGLNTSSIDLEKGEIRIHGKRNKERIVPLTVNLMNLLPGYLEERSKCMRSAGIHDKLIVTDNGNPAYPRMIQRMVRKYLTQSTTLEKRSPHLLRHTFATHMLNRGADLNAVKELLGHANLAATEIYTHNTYEKLKSIYKQAHPRA